MDPSMFLQYPPPSGVPQESKLATYMNRSVSTPVPSLTHALDKVSLDSSANKKIFLGPECFSPCYYAPQNLIPMTPKSAPSTALLMQSPPQPHVHHENVGGTTYFYSTNSDGINANGPHNLSHNVSAELPETLEMYRELTPLGRSLGHGMPHAWSLRGRHRTTGELVALRRLPQQQPSPHAAKKLDLWKQVIHPNVVRLRDVFTSTAFDDHSIVLVYDYHPGGVTLLTKYLASGPGSSTDSGAFHDPFSSDPDAPRPYTHQKNAILRAVASGQLLPEPVLWSLLVQLTAALRAVHSLGLACRNLDPSKVIMNGCRVRVAWGGAVDASSAGGGVSDAQAQQDDLASLGRLALALATRSLHTENLPASMDLVARTYSADLKNLILFLLSMAPAHRSVTDLMPIIGARFYTQVEALECRADAVEEQLLREVDNGRLLRILIKLGVVNERPELNLDASWSETGDRYMLKLFRDYLFHSVSADGRPWLDQAHLTNCLNHLDAGSPEKVELMSRDEQSVLVVSYAELKHCLEQAFEEVTQAAATPQ